MSAESIAAGCILDVTGALARLGGDKVLFVEMAGFFFEDAPRLLAELREAVQEGSPQNIRMSAHALKGLVAGCGGVRATNAAEKVESAGQRKDLKNVSQLVDALGEELELLKQALSAYCG